MPRQKSSTKWDKALVPTTNHHDFPHYEYLPPTTKPPSPSIVRRAKNMARRIPPPMLPFDEGLRYNSETNKFTFGNIYTPQTGTSDYSNVPKQWSCYLPGIVSRMSNTLYHLSSQRIGAVYDHRGLKKCGRKQGYYLMPGQDVNVDKLFAEFRTNLQNGTYTHCFFLLSFSRNPTSKKSRFAHAVVVCIQLNEGGHQSGTASSADGGHGLKATCFDNANHPTKNIKGLLEERLFTTDRGFKPEFEMIPQKHAHRGWWNSTINTLSNDHVIEIETKHNINYKDRRGYCDTWSVIFPYLMMKHNITEMRDLVAALRPVVASSDKTMAARRLLYVRCFYAVMCEQADTTYRNSCDAPCSTYDSAGNQKEPPQLVLAYENKTQLEPLDDETVPFSVALDCARNGVARLAQLGHSAHPGAQGKHFSRAMTELELRAAYEEARTILLGKPIDHHGISSTRTAWDALFSWRGKNRVDPGADPHIVYLGRGWRSWKHFLFRPSYASASVLVQNYAVIPIATPDKSEAVLKAAYAMWWNGNSAQDRAFLPRHPDKEYGLESIITPSEYADSDFFGADTDLDAQAGTWGGWHDFLCPKHTYTYATVAHLTSTNPGVRLRAHVHLVMVQLQRTREYFRDLASGIESADGWANAQLKKAGPPPDLLTVEDVAVKLFGTPSDDALRGDQRMMEWVNLIESPGKGNMASWPGIANDPHIHRKPTSSVAVKEAHAFSHVHEPPDWEGWQIVDQANLPLRCALDEDTINYQATILDYRADSKPTNESEMAGDLQAINDVVEAISIFRNVDPLASLTLADEETRGSPPPATADVEPWSWRASPGLKPFDLNLHDDAAVKEVAALLGFDEREMLAARAVLRRTFSNFSRLTVVVGDCRISCHRGRFGEVYRFTPMAPVIKGHLVCRISSIPQTNADITSRLHELETFHVPEDPSRSVHVSHVSQFHFVKETKRIPTASDPPAPPGRAQHVHEGILAAEAAIKGAANHVKRIMGNRDVWAEYRAPEHSAKHKAAWGVTSASEKNDRAFTDTATSDDLLEAIGKFRRSARKRVPASADDPPPPFNDEMLATGIYITKANWDAVATQTQWEVRSVVREVCVIIDTTHTADVASCNTTNGPQQRHMMSVERLPPLWVGPTPVFFCEFFDKPANKGGEQPGHGHSKHPTHCRAHASPRSCRPAWTIGAASTDWKEAEKQGKLLVYPMNMYESDREFFARGQSFTRNSRGEPVRRAGTGPLTRRQRWGRPGLAQPSAYVLIKNADPPCRFFT